MNYYIEGLPRHVDVVAVDKAVLYAIEHLNIDQTLLDLITIEFDSDIGDDGIDGLCDVEDGQILITIDPLLGTQDVVRTVLHEMTHAKQILHGELNHIGNYQADWCGSVIDYSWMQYRDLPWEVEAFEFEERAMKVTTIH